MSTQLKTEPSELRPRPESPAFENTSQKVVAPAGNLPEVQLLLACARTVIDDANAERIRSLLRGNIDWANAIEQAETHRVMPLLYRALNQVCPELVPANVLSQLNDYVVANAQYNLYRTRELIRILQLFESHGIPALPFKGPVLSVLAYGNLGLRDYGDLDVLVRQQDVLRTKALLIGEGYHLVARSPHSHTEPHFSPRRKDLIFDSSDGQVRLELHWRLTGLHFDFPLNLTSLWEHLETVSLASSRVRTLATQDLLLYLCIHGSRHGWERLLWVCDVAELLRANSTIDWESVTVQAGRLGSKRTLALGLILARDLLGLELAANVWRMVEVEPGVEALALRLRESLFQTEECERGISYWNDIHLRMRERLSDRLKLRLHYYRRYLRLAVVPNELDHAIVNLPQGLSFLYYLLRSGRLLKRLGLTGLSKITRPRGNPGNLS